MLNNKSFDDINSMLMEGQEGMVRAQLLDANTGRVKRDYAWDRNHAWYCVGEADFKMGCYKKAIDSFRKAYKADSCDVQCLLAIGNCFDAMNKPEMAEKVLRKALEFDVKGKVRASIIFNLANALLDQRKFDEARDFYALVKERRDEIGRRARKNLKMIFI